jgi:DNA-binding NarL/FixJ family response regulator
MIRNPISESLSGSPEANPADVRGAGLFSVLERYGLSTSTALVVLLACRGLECKEIASLLHLSESSIKKKLRCAARRLNARGRGHLCALSGMLASGMSLAEAEQSLRKGFDAIG